MRGVHGHTYGIGPPPSPLSSYPSSIAVFPLSSYLSFILHFPFSPFPPSFIASLSPSFLFHLAISPLICLFRVYSMFLALGIPSAFSGSIPRLLLQVYCIPFTSVSYARDIWYAPCGCALRRLLRVYQASSDAARTPRVRMPCVGRRRGKGHRGCCWAQVSGLVLWAFHQGR